MFPLIFQLLAILPFVTALPAPDVAVVTAVRVNQVVNNDIVVVNVDDQSTLSTSSVQHTMTQVYITMVASNTTTSTTSSTTSSSTVSTTTITSVVTPPAPSSTSTPAPTTQTAVINSFASPVAKAVGPAEKDVVSSSSPLDSCNTASHPDQCRLAVGQHNKYRAMHSAPPLVWDENLAQIAASKMATAPCAMNDYIDLDHFPTQDHIGYQSNAAQGGSTLADATDNWYGEHTTFEQVGGYGLTQSELAVAEPDYDKIGHFVNVIFKGHTSIGCTQNLQCDPSSYSGTNFLCLYAPYALNDDDFRTNLLPN